MGSFSSWAVFLTMLHEGSVFVVDFAGRYPSQLARVSIGLAEMPMPLLSGNPLNGTRPIGEHNRIEKFEVDTVLAGMLLHRGS